MRDTITNDTLSEAFDAASARYDLMVALNPGYHAHLRSAGRALVECLPSQDLRDEQRPTRLVDLGCGSGASTRALQQSAAAVGLTPEIVGVDASAGMLAQARAKRWPPGVRFELGSAEDLAFARESWGLADRVPGVLACYLFRNVQERDKVLSAVFDLIADDGVLVVQEYSVAGSRRARLVWDLVCWLVVVPLSMLTFGHSAIYRYLWRSVHRFDSVQTFVDRLYGAGFTEVEVRSVPGWQRGILHTFRARKPATPAEA